jgi:hypothetical protein
MKHISLFETYSSINENTSPCVKQKVSKQMVEQKSKEIDKYLEEQVKKSTDKHTKNLNSIYKKEIISLINEIKPLSKKISQNLLFAYFGVITTYNPLPDYKEIYNKVFNQIMSKLDGNILFKGAASLYINSSNVANVKKEVEDALDTIIVIIEKSIIFPFYKVKNNIKDSFPKCSDGESSVLKYPTNIKDVETQRDQLIKKMNTEINKKINSFV